MSELTAIEKFGRTYVRLSRLGESQFPAKKGKIAEVQGYAKNHQEIVMVRWNGAKTKVSMHMDFLELVEGETPCGA